MTWWNKAVNAASSGADWLAHGNRIKLAVIALTAILAALILYNWRSTAVENAVLKHDNARVEANNRSLEQTRVADQAATAVRETVRLRVEKKAEQDRVAITEALEAHPGWADQPIPADVLDGLRKARED